MRVMYLTTPEIFSFKSTIYSHGWSDLAPFNLIEKPLQLSYTFDLSADTHAYVKIIAADKNRIKIAYNTDHTAAEKNEVTKVVKRIFRLNDDYTEFYELAEKTAEFSWIVDYGAGRMLRAASLWEDMVKMLCTTNCTWRLTQIMVDNLVSKLGTEVSVSGSPMKTKTFPNARSLADCDESFLRNEIKMGYRAPYLLAFAKAVAANEIDLDRIEDKSHATTDLYKQIRNIKGFGDYAVSNLLKLLGHYDYLGADSWSRQKFFEKHRKGKPCEDRKIQNYYKKYGKWSGLFFWMDVIEHWYREELPWP